MLPIEMRETERLFEYEKYLNEGLWKIDFSGFARKIHKTLILMISFIMI